MRGETFTSSLIFRNLPPSAKCIRSLSFEHAKSGRNKLDSFLVLHFSSRPFQLKQLEESAPQKPRTSSVVAAQRRRKEENSSISEIRYFSLTPLLTLKSVGLFYFKLPLACQTVCPFHPAWSLPITQQFKALHRLRRKRKSLLFWKQTDVATDWNLLRCEGKNC